MIWEAWFTLVMALILIGTVIWTFIRIKKKENSVEFFQYLFKYRIGDDDAEIRSMQFLVNWQISNLVENHLYLLYLTLEGGLDMEDYLHSVWVDYEGLNNVYIEVYRVEGIVDIKNVFVGKFCIVV